MSKVRKIDYSPDEFLVGVAGMKCREGHVYWVVCSLVMSTGGPIDEDDERLFSIIKERPGTIKRALDVLVSRGKLLKDGTKLSQSRAEDELRAAQIRIAKSAEGGVKSGETRRKQAAENEQKQDVSSKGLKIKNEPGPEPSLTPPPSPPSSPNTTSAKLMTFDDFWALYPRKVGKAAAEKKFSQLRKEGRLPGADELKAAIDSYIRNKSPDVDYCHPTTWLNQGRWDDEHEVAVTREEWSLAEDAPPWQGRMLGRVGQSEFRAWFEKREIWEKGDGSKTAVVACKTKFEVDHIRTQFGQHLEASFNGYKIEYKITGE